jgi:hypothetical protein
LVAYSSAIILRTVLRRLKKPLGELTLFDITGALEAYAVEKFGNDLWLDWLSELDLYTTGDVLSALYDMGFAYEEVEALRARRAPAHVG